MICGEANAEKDGFDSQDPGVSSSSCRGLLGVGGAEVKAKRERVAGPRRDAVWALRDLC